MALRWLIIIAFIDLLLILYVWTSFRPLREKWLATFLLLVVPLAGFGIYYYIFGPGKRQTNIPKDWDQK